MIMPEWPSKRASRVLALFPVGSVVIKPLVAVGVASILLASLAYAGLRGPGKYCGVVIFDRWGGCTLYSGIYVMYVSEAVKEQLRPVAGKSVQVDATDVDQPHNPGDGLIKKLKILGPAPAAKGSQSYEGLKLTVASAFDDGNAPQFFIRAENIGEKAITLRMDSLAPTLLAPRTRGNDPWTSDGPSTAVITRQTFFSLIDGPQTRGATGAWQWTVTAPHKLERNLSLDPKAVFEIRLSFTLPAGEYQFLAGYGGGVHENQCIASNLVGFDVKEDGTATLMKSPRDKRPLQ